MKVQARRARNAWQRRLIGGGLIALATALVYLPVFRAGFVWDDNTILTDNPFVKLPAGLFYIWASTALPDYFPLTYTSFWLEWRLWGPNPLGYHLTNVLLHAASAILLWRVLSRLRLPGAWLAALVFALHPVNVQSVAWIAERKNTLCMFFCLLSLLWYFRWHEGRLALAGAKSEPLDSPSPGAHERFYRISLLAFLLALLSKTAVVMLPVALLLYHWWQAAGGAGFQSRAEHGQQPVHSKPPAAPRNAPRSSGVAAAAVSAPPSAWAGFSRDLLRLAPFFALALGLGLVTMWFQAHRAIAGDVIREADWLTRLAAAGQAVWFYVQKLFWPTELCFVYPQWTTDPGSFVAWLPWAGVLAVFALGWWFRRGWGRHLIFAWGWFVLFLLPVLGFVNIYFHRYALVADHWVYFAEISLIALLVGAGAFWFARYRREAVACLLPTVATFAVLGLGASTWRQAGVYRNIGTLWTDTLRKNPDCWLAHNSLGNLLAAAGEWRAAREHLERALAIKPDAPEVLNNFASVLLDRGHSEEAIIYLRKALELAPRSAMAWYNLGNAYDQQGNLAEAEKHYRRAIELDPTHAEAHNNLGCLLYATGRKSEATDAFAQAISLRPDYADALNNLGALFLEEGRFQQAESLLVEAVRHQPAHADAWFNLANALLPQGRLREAVRAYEHVLALNPRHALAHARRGTALWHLGNVSEARAALTRALELQPDLAEAHHQLGILLAAEQKSAEALAHLRRAVELQPEWPEGLAGLAFTLATASRDADRDGAEALRLATRAADLTGRTNVIALDALAAALAENANFAEAARTAAAAAERARALGDTNRAEQIQQRQRAYESGKPHRQ